MNTKKAAFPLAFPILLWYNTLAYELEEWVEPHSFV